MAEVPFSLAVLGLFAPVVAGALPLLAGWIRETASQKRAAAEQLRTEQAQLVEGKRAQCIELLRQAHDFRVLVENTCDSSGADLDARAEQVRQSAANIASLADEIEFRVPGAESEALCLATAASQLAVPVADRESRKLRTSLDPPDFTEFDTCREEFKRAARAAVGDQPSVSAGRAVADTAKGTGRRVLNPAPEGIQEASVRV